MNKDNMEKTFISAVVYVHNEEKNLNDFFQVLHNTLQTNFKKYEIIIVNDCSTDESVENIERLAQSYDGTTISIINMGVFQGVELSMTAGIDLAIGDFIFEFDNINIKYDEDIIVSLYKRAIEGYDIVSAGPKKPKSITSKLFYNIFNKYKLSYSTLGQEVCRIVSRRAINRVQSLNKNISYRKAVYSSCGLKTDKIIYNKTDKGKFKNNKESKQIREELAFEALVLYTNTIQKVSALISFLFLFFTIACGIYTWVAFFGAHKPVEGWTATMLFLSISFFGVFLMLTMVLKYLSIILNLIYKKQRYMIESIEKITNN